MPPPAPRFPRNAWLDAGSGVNTNKATIKANNCIMDDLKDTRRHKSTWKIRYRGCV